MLPVNPGGNPMSNVSFILVYVDDVAASEAFYGSILGRGAIESSPTFAMLPAAPGLMLGLWKRRRQTGSRRRQRRDRLHGSERRRGRRALRRVARARCRHRSDPDDNGVRLHV